MRRPESVDQPLQPTLPTRRGDRPVRLTRGLAVLPTQPGPTAGTTDLDARFAACGLSFGWWGGTKRLTPTCRHGSRPTDRRRQPRRPDRRTRDFSESRCRHMRGRVSSVLPSCAVCTPAVLTETRSSLSLLATGVISPNRDSLGARCRVPGCRGRRGGNGRPLASDRPRWYARGVEDASTAVRRVTRRRGVSRDREETP